MTTATKSRKQVKPARSAKVQTVGGATVLWLSVGKDITAYLVRQLDSQIGGTAFRLVKANKGDGATEEYEVLLDGERSLCCCKGFEQHGMCKDGKGCKHIAGLNAALASGQLQATPRPAPPPQATRAPIELEDL